MIPQERFFVPFPDPWTPENEITFDQFVSSLLIPESSAYLIHGGPGSGKTTLMHHLAETLNRKKGIVALGPIAMSPYRGQIPPEILLRELVDEVLDTLARYEIRAAGPISDWASAWSTSALLRVIEEALRQATTKGVGRVVLLLDDFDDLHLWAAINLANRLRMLFDAHKRYLTFVLTAESDLEELRSAEHIYSPLVNICTPLMLRDLLPIQMRQHALTLAQELSLSLSEDDLEEIWDWTEGYPALVNALLRTLAHERKRQSDFHVREAVAHCIQNYHKIEPMRTARREIEELSNLNIHQYNPAHVLDLLVRGTTPAATDRGARMLLAMGILGWRGRAGREYLTWRNRLIQSFWEDEQSGRRLVAEWHDRPLSFREGQLSGQGTLVVSFFLDLGDLLLEKERAAYSMRRGTKAWTNALRALVDELPSGPYELWREQHRLTNIGYDLNLFREQTVQQFFMPVYEARTQDIDLELSHLLVRFGDKLPDPYRQQAEEMIATEWRRWHRVRVQFTRDGALHVALLRDLENPLPLMQILDELLGLERELSSGDLVELSVQWELALAAAATFMRQLGGADFPHIPALNITWRGPKAAPAPGEVYPLRDRYVIYMLRKLCNCRRGGMQPSSQRRLITIEDLYAIRGLDGSHGDRYQEAYNYGRELTCLLEGVMVREHIGANRETGRFPYLKHQEVQRLLDDDLASWQNELFLASLDNALFVYQANAKLGGSADSTPEPSLADGVCQVCTDWEKRTIGELHFPKRTASYEDYWQCLTLGLQYIIELRWSAQWVARHTTNDLNQLADLMEKDVADRPEAEIEALRRHLALTTRLLAHLRDASIPMFMTSADYAASKYEKVIEVSGLRETISNAEKNITALNSFLYHHEEQITQQRAEEQNQVISRLGIILAILATIAVLPSMWIDFAGTGDTSLWHYLSQIVPSGWRTRDDTPLFFLSIATIFIIYTVWRSVRVAQRRSRPKK